MSIEPKKGTQHYDILRELRKGRVLTGIDGLSVAQSMKLSTRISELKKMGHNILSEPTRTDTGKRISKYWLSKAFNETHSEAIKNEEMIRHSYEIQEQAIAEKAADPIHYKEKRGQLAWV